MENYQKPLMAVLAISMLGLGACSSSPFSGKSEKTSLSNIGTIDKDGQRSDLIPNWYINVPKDGEEKIYGSGSGLSSDLQFSIDKAIHQAKVVLGDKISNEVSAELKTYMSDNSQIGNGITVEETQKVSKSGFKNVDISQYDITNKEVYKEDDKFRTYILLEIDPRGRKSNKAVVVKQSDIDDAQAESRKALGNL